MSTWGQWNGAPKITSFLKTRQKEATPTPQLDRDVFRCDLCRVEMASPALLLQHLNGEPHQRAASIAVWKGKQGDGTDGGNVAQDSSSIPDLRGDGPFRCELCGIELRTAASMRTHLEGTPHRREVERRQKQGRKGREFGCQMCDVRGLGSVLELAQHTLGADHKSRLDSLLCMQDPSPDLAPPHPPVVPFEPPTFFREEDTMPRQYEQQQQQQQQQEVVVRVGQSQFHCRSCDKALNSRQQLQEHLTSKTHRKKNPGSSSSPAPTPIFPHPAATASNFAPITKPTTSTSVDIDFDDLPGCLIRTAGNEYKCKTCGKALNSQLSARQHLSSKKHQMKEAQANADLGDDFAPTRQARRPHPYGCDTSSGVPTFRQGPLGGGSRGSDRWDKSGWAPQGHYSQFRAGGKL